MCEIPKPLGVEEHEAQRPRLSPEQREERIQFYQDRLYPGWPWWLLPVIAIELYIGTVAVVCWARFGTNCDAAKVASAILIGAWTLGPPSWFFMEYFHMPYIDSERLPNIEGFKYTREMASKFWVAAVVVLGALATGHFSGAGE